jgi:hypothetical protein
MYRIMKKDTIKKTDIALLILLVIATIALAVEFVSLPSQDVIHLEPPIFDR